MPEPARVTALDTGGIAGTAAWSTQPVSTQESLLGAGSLGSFSRRRAHRRALSWVIAVLLLDYIVVFLLSARFLPGFEVNLTRHFSFTFGLYGILIASFLYGYVLHTLLIVKPTNVLAHWAAAVRRHCLSPEKLVFSFPVLALIPAEKALFVSFKSRIPEVQPFQWDVYFFGLDRFLHAGVDPWVLLHPALGEAAITRVIEFFYHHVWFFLFVVVVLWHALGSHALELRLRFFVSYIAIWLLLGNIAAVLFSSAGPCYFDRITGLASPYEPLMDYLATVHAQGPLISVALQQSLWDGYVNGTGYGGGISAMPAMHVALVMLFTLSAWPVNRTLGMALLVYLVVVMAGSVHLAWHYAVDGYLAIACTWAIWRLAGIALARDRTLEPAPPTT